MRITTLLILNLLFTLITHGQPFNKNYFNKTKWFTKNKDKEFYQADTLNLIKYSNYGTGNESKDYAEDEVSFYHETDLVLLEFLDKNKLNLSEQHISNWEISVRRGAWSWKFDQKGILVNIYFNKKLLYKFKPISEKKVKTKSKFAYHQELSTIELTLIRVKP